MAVVEMTSLFFPFTQMREHLGFVPRLFLAQQASSRSLEAQAFILDAVWFRDGVLSRVERERLLAAAARALGNSYASGIHIQMLMLHGESEASAHAIAADFRTSPLDGKTLALLRFVVKAAACGETLYQGDFDVLAAAGWSDAAASEALAVAGLAGLLAALARTFAPRPDFGFPLPPVVPSVAELCGDGAGAPTPRPALTLRSDIEGAVQQAWDKLAMPPAEAAGSPPARVAGQNDEEWMEAVCAYALGCFGAIVSTGLAAAQIAHPAAAGSRPTFRNDQPAAEVADPDHGLLVAARQGDASAFEKLVHLHGRRVYRTVAGILGDAEEARDAMQDTFLKAYDRLRSFEGRSKFSTWLTSIAVNAALQRLRERRPMDSLDDTSDEPEATFRPRHVQAWGDSPEQRYAKLELKELVQREVRRLPVKYRTAVVLRDIEQLSTEEAADALGLGIPTLKSRLLRGRLLLREALSPHFVNSAAAGSAGALQ